MADWLIRHPTALTVVAAVLVLSAIGLEIGDLTRLRGGTRVLAAVVFIVAAALAYLGFQAAWQRRARRGTLVVDPAAQAQAARQGVWPGLAIAALLIFVVSIVGPGLESAIYGAAVGLFSFSLVGRRRMSRLQA